jgi:homocysteine S-methyltransferase
MKSKFQDIMITASHPLILDGAVGSLIQQMGFKPDKFLWTGYINFKYPDILRTIHLEYIRAGSDIITSNTFRTNPAAIKRAGMGLDLSEAVNKSMEISRIIADEHGVYLAGSNPPAEDSYQYERTLKKEEVEYNHKKHIELLYEYGADFILNETQSHHDEISIICKYCSENNIPFCVSLFFTKDFKLLSGEPLAEVIEEIKTYKPAAILVNCITKKTFSGFLEKIEIDFPWGFYINCGSGHFADSNIECGIDPTEYSEIVKKTLKLHPKIIGACCGSNPEHIKSISGILNE